MQVGPYAIHSELGRGGMATVYRAADAAGNVVALKLMHQGLAFVPQTRKRFEHEAQSLARLHHPGVVRLLNSGEHQGTFWLALEFVEGTSLQQKLHSGPLDVGDAILVTEQLAAALAYVHRCGILHRDVKPDNVLLRPGQALLTDFGLALTEELERTRMTRSGAFLGTPGYWAPEAARGERDRVGPAADVYGLGAVLYACLTGDAPIRASTIQEFLAQTERVRIEPPRADRGDVPPWLSTLCMRCLAHDPGHRPSMNELVQLLQAGGPPARRVRPWAIALGLAATLILGALLATTPWATDTSPPRATDSHELPTPASSHELPTPASAAELPTPASAAELLDKAKAEARNGRFAEALLELNRAIELDPETPEAFQTRSAVFKQLARHEDALADLDRALVLAPQRIEAREDRARLLLALGRHAAALLDLDAVLQQDPSNGLAHIDRGTCLNYTGAFADALLAFDRGLELEPKNAVGYVNRAGAYMGLGKLQAALLDLEQAQRLNPDLPNLPRSKGVIKRELGQLEEALADLNESLRLQPNDSLALEFRAETLLRQGRYADAIQDLDRALKSGPSPQQTQKLRELREQASAKLGR